jgi:hypothetical protein
MGLFSFFKRKKGKVHSSPAPEVLPIAKSWHHSLSSLALVTDPLGNTSGTHLERDFLFSTLQSLSLAISAEGAEVANPVSPFKALVAEVAAKAASEDLTLSHLDVVGLSFDEAMGYAARVSAHSKKYTVLLGAHAAVARASTPFHADIATFVAQQTSVAREVSESSSSQSFVLAIDGIAYAALTTESELR